jgi:hypothetical protein
VTSFPDTCTAVAPVSVAVPIINSIVTASTLANIAHVCTAVASDLIEALRLSTSAPGPLLQWYSCYSRYCTLVCTMLLVTKLTLVLYSGSLPRTPIDLIPLDIAIAPEPYSHMLGDVIEFLFPPFTVCMVRCGYIAACLGVYLCIYFMVVLAWLILSDVSPPGDVSNQLTVLIEDAVTHAAYDLAAATVAPATIAAPFIASMVTASTLTTFPDAYTNVVPARDVVAPINAAVTGVAPLISVSLSAVAVAAATSTSAAPHTVNVTEPVLVPAMLLPPGSAISVTAPLSHWYSCYFRYCTTVCTVLMVFKLMLLIFNYFWTLPQLDPIRWDTAAATHLVDSYRLLWTKSLDALLSWSLRLCGCLLACLCVCVCLYVICVCDCMYASVCAWMQVDVSILAWRRVRMCMTYMGSALFLPPQPSEAGSRALTARRTSETNTFPNKNQPMAWHHRVGSSFKTALWITWSHHQAMINKDTTKPP